VHPRSTPSAPQAEQESIFRTFLLYQEDLEFELVVLDIFWRRRQKKVVKFLRKKVHRLLKATSKKRRQLFLGKSAPPDKILATPMRGIHIIAPDMTSFWCLVPAVSALAVCGTLITTGLMILYNEVKTINN